MEHRYKLSRTVSYRNLGELAALIDHSSGLEAELNGDAGAVLDLLDLGEALPADEGVLAFVRELADLGVAISLDESSTKVAEAAGHRAVAGQVEAAAAEVDEDAAEEDLYDSLKAWATKKVLPISAMLELTGRCPLECRHCYLRGVDVGERGELSAAEWEGVLEQLRELGTLYLVLTGGEPMAHPGFDELFCEARRRRFSVSVLTSGILASEDRLARMVELGLEGLQVSIYGAEAATHDAHTRTAGSFDAAMGTLRTLRRLGGSGQAAIGLSRLNFADGLAAARMLEGEGIEYRFNAIMLPSRAGASKPVRPEEDLNVSEEELVRFLRCFPPTEPGRMAAIGGDDPPCEAGRSVVAVDWAGKVLPCMEIREAAGDVTESRLDEIWRKSDLLRGLRKIRGDDLEECAGCRLRPVCDRCAGYAMGQGRTLVGASPLDCRYANARILAGGLASQKGETD